MKPLVSVLLPVYNAEAWIGEALQSLFAQTYAHWEIIVVDDGSTDASASAVKSFRDARIRLVTHPENRGLIATLNHAASLAQGEYLARMDADDRALPERLARQVRVLEEEDEISVVGSAIRFFSAESTWYKETRRPLIHPSRPAEMKATLPFYSSLGHGAAMFRRSLVDNIKICDEYGHPAFYDAAFVHAEDYELWTRLALQGHRLRSLPQVLQEVRLHGSSVSQKQSQTQKKNADQVRARWRQVLGLKANETALCVQSQMGRLDFPHDPQFLQEAEALLSELFCANETAKLFEPQAWEQVLSLRWWQTLHALCRSTPSLRWKALHSKFSRAADPYGLRQAHLILKTLLP